MKYNQRLQRDIESFFKQIQRGMHSITWRGEVRLICKLHVGASSKRDRSNLRLSTSHRHLSHKQLLGEGRSRRQTTKSTKIKWRWARLVPINGWEKVWRSNHRLHTTRDRYEEVRYSRAGRYILSTPNPIGACYALNNTKDKNWKTSTCNPEFKSSSTTRWQI